MFILLNMDVIELKFLMFKIIRTASRPALTTTLSIINNTFFADPEDLMSEFFSIVF